jgi:SAM-dependent methyltransferase
VAHLTPELLEFVLRWLPTPPVRVIDVGCGDGALTRRLAGEGYDAVGLDPEAPEGEGFVRSTLEELPPGSEFDAAVAVRSLHHLRDPDLGLDNLHALLRPGGRLVAFEFAVENVDEAALRWLEERDLPPPVRESPIEEVIPLQQLRRQVERRFRLLAEQPTTYLVREAGREDLVGEEEAAVREGILRPAGMRLAYERFRLEDSPV